MEDIINPHSLATKLSEGTDPLSTYLRGRLNSEAKVRLSAPQTSGTNSQELRVFLVEQLDAIIRGPPVYEAKRFQNIRLSESTENLRKESPNGEGLIRLNRKLLDDVYWHELRDHKQLSEMLSFMAISLCPVLPGIFWMRCQIKKTQVTGRELQSYAFRQPLVIVAAILAAVAGIINFIGSFKH
jgi:hypothetical protein